MGDTATLEEAVTDEQPSSGERTKRLRLPWTRPKHHEEPDDSERDVAEEASPPPNPLAYTTFSSKLAPALTAVGGLLAVLGGLGVWVRATVVEAEGIAPEEVVATSGYNDPEGLTIAVFGAVAIVTSMLWLRQRPVFKVLPSVALKLVPALASVAIIALAIWQLPLIDREAATLAQEAIERADFVSYHAGLGWGAWCLMAGAVFLFLGTMVGILREIDVRKGTAT